jgi:hypothetical protein
MFYIRSMVKESKRTGANPALNGLLPAPKAGEGGGGYANPKNEYALYNPANPANVVDNPATATQ